MVKLNKNQLKLDKKKLKSTRLIRQSTWKGIYNFNLYQLG
jgi:hypothetical protein